MPRLSVLTTRTRIERIDDRTENTRIPQIHDVYKRTDTISESLAKDVIDKMFFSEYPSAKEDGVSALSSFLMNSGNINELKHTGSLGAVVELLRRVNFKTTKPEYVSSLVNALYTLTVNDNEADKNMLEKLITNPHGVSVIVNLCIAMSGRLQEICLNIVVALSKLEQGINSLLNNNNIGKVLSSYELLIRNSTFLHVKHTATILINKFSAIKPELFPLNIFDTLILDALEHRKVDGFMEMQLLTGFLHHIKWLNNRNEKLRDVFYYFKYLTNELITETFENLDHMQLIVKAIVKESKDPKQLDYLIKHKLSIALQYLIRTDFMLFRKKANRGTETVTVNKNIKNNKYKRLSIQDTGERPIRTLQALTLVKPKAPIETRSDEINYFATSSSVKIYENIMKYRLEIIPEIISSGLLSALLFRVGKGSERDYRMNKLMLNFIYNLIMKVIILFYGKNHPDILHSISLSSIFPLPKIYVRYGETCAKKFSIPIEVLNDASYDENNKLNDLRATCNSLQAQGVITLLYSNLSGEDGDNIKVAITSLSLMSFGSFRDEALLPENLNKLFSITSYKNDCFIAGISIICALILSNPPESVLSQLVINHKAVSILISALKLSGWKFHEKDIVFQALSKLAFHSQFSEKISECSGYSYLIAYIKAKKKNFRRRKHDDDDDDGIDEEEAADDGIQIVYRTIKRDFLLSKVQAVLKRSIVRIRSQRLLFDRRAKVIQEDEKKNESSVNMRKFK